MLNKSYAMAVKSVKRHGFQKFIKKVLVFKKKRIPLRTDLSKYFAQNKNI